jgi:putative ATP-binding cassette transporter
MKFTVKLLNAAAIFVSFVAKLWKLSGIVDFEIFGIGFRLPGYIVWIAFIYAAAGTWLTHWVGRKLIAYNVDQQRYEADFRYGMMRVRENAESVAFHGGGNDEGRRLKDRLALLLDNFKKIIRTEKHLIGIRSAYGQIANIFPVLVAAPRYMIKEINLGGLMQTASAFTQVQRALSFFIELYASFAEWLAVIRRLDGFSQSLARAQEHWPNSGLVRRTHSGDSIEARNLDLYLPSGARLLHDLNFCFQVGENVLIKGPNGSGKSTLLRTLAGIWPFARGEIILPASGRRMFVAQKNYLPFGTLREILLYPSDISHNDQKLQECLEQCGIGHLSKYLNLEADWYQVFSPGEQQRLAIARAFIHVPSWLFLDESTSSMDEQSECTLYSLLSEKMPGTTVISIAHRENLRQFHSREFRLNEVFIAKN